MMARYEHRLRSEERRRRNEPERNPYLIPLTVMLGIAIVTAILVGLDKVPLYTFPAQ